MKALFIPGCMQLPPMKRWPSSIKEREILLFHLTISAATLANSIEGSTWFDGDEAQVKLRNAILKLPEKQRIVFNLKYFDEMKYEDMSKALKTSEGALKASYHHAVKKIENFLSGN